jgi:hypothetical protein
VQDWVHCPTRIRLPAARILSEETRKEEIAERNLEIDTKRKTYRYGIDAQWKDFPKYMDSTYENLPVIHLLSI